jgi:hypothetical protein
MSKSDPFVSKAFVNVLKYMEVRWGLTLVSFIPSNAHEKIVSLQKGISYRWNKCTDTKSTLRNFYFEFYHPSHFHCTHFTLKRSTPCGPIKTTSLVKKNYKIIELFNIISEAVSKIKAIEVELDRLTLSSGDGVGLILLGQCANQGSVDRRSSLLTDLNSALPKYFDLNTRKWDSEPSKFHELHSCTGFQKRRLPHEYEYFAEEIKKIISDPISFTLEEVTLVHHNGAWGGAFPIGK